MPDADFAITLEFQLNCVSGDDYALSARLIVPQSAGDASLIIGAPAAVRFDPEALLALRNDLAAYGARLSEMLFADQRVHAALLKAHSQATALHARLRFVLRLDPTDPTVHTFLWETLSAPDEPRFLFSGEQIVLSRYFESDSLTPLRLRPKHALRMLVAVANPRDLSSYDLAPINVSAEIARATEMMDPAQVRVIGAKQYAVVNLTTLSAELRDGPDILYLVCHGSNRAGQPILWLEREDGSSERVNGTTFAQMIAGLDRPPLLVVLASCQSAGDGQSDALTALGPQLARAGVAAVLAMQGNLTMETAALTLPLFFRELQRDGQIDRAVAVARAAAIHRPDWWAPVLFLRLRDGRIWSEAASAAPAAPVDRNRQRMLAKVRDFWVRGVLEAESERKTTLDPSIVLRPAALDNPWESLVKVETPVQQEAIRFKASCIIEVFDKAQGELLILGGPGSGKTTLLLMLARALIDRAEHDPDHAIPVVFHLASWHMRAGSLDRWLVEELYSRYDVPRQIGQAWVAQRQLLPLLDGFDEVAADQRPACLAAINSYDRDTAIGSLVVCSRVGEYDSAGARLRLNGAVEVLPLSESDVLPYLEGSGESLANVRALYRSDRQFRSVLETPLMLNVVSAAYGGDAIIPNTISQEIWRKYIFGAYVSRMLERRSGSHEYPQVQVVHWLNAIALLLANFRQGVFLIERLQPLWLSRPLDRLFYGILLRLLSGLSMGTVTAALILPVAGWRIALPAALLAIIAWSLSWGRLAPRFVSLTYGCAVGLGLILSVPLTQPEYLLEQLERARTAVGSDFWLIVGYMVAYLILGIGITGFGTWLVARQVRFASIDSVASLRWSWKAGLRAAVLAGCLGGLPAIVLLALLTRDWTIMLPAGIAVGMIVGTISGLAVGMTARSLELSTRPNDGIRRTLRTALRVAAIAGPSFGVVGVLLGIALGNAAENLSLELIPGITNIWLTGLSGLLAGTLVAFLAFGGLVTLQHFLVRFFLWRSGAAPWRYAAFLDWCVERALLRRVGGGYIFIHRTLQEYFADKPEL